MKTNKLYKLIVPLLFLVGSIGVAWGQEKNNSEKVKYGTEATVNDSETEIKIQSLTTTTATQSGDNINLDCLWKYDDGNKWWAADKAGAVTFNIKPASYAVIDKIFIIRGSKQEEQPVSIELTYTDIENATKKTKTFTVNRKVDSGSVGTSDADNMLLILDTPIKGASTISITLTPNNEETNKIALNKIRFYGKEFEISHKTTKWYNMRKSYTQNGKPDKFDDKTEWFDSSNSSVAGNLQMQPAHHYTDTIYMRKGDTHTLILPDKHSTQDTYEGINNKSYRRWYNYLTDGDCSNLLTPIEGDPATYKIENGYLNLPYLENNAGEKAPYKMTFTYPDTGNESYIIACDVSNYLDLELKEEDESYTLTEPTLSHRILYYIKAIPDNMDEDYYHEEYNISFPFTRISNHTLDMVALSKDADAYAFLNENENDTDAGKLTVKITGENSANISLAKPYGYKDTDGWFTINDDGTATLSGNHRIISFAYPNKRKDGTQYVGPEKDDGKTDNYTATIEVTKTVGETIYNIATYNLTFKRNTVLLTQSIITDLEEDKGNDEEKEPWDGYKFRTPKALADNYGLPLRELNWDYASIEIDGNYNKEYYPYPMDWSYSTYGFFDGSNDKEIIAYTQNTPYPEWGHYGITSNYIETFWGGAKVNPPKKELENSIGEKSSFHLYVDASDRPGTIARLAFPGDLCAGSEIIVSAWVKSAASWQEGGNQDDASALFTIMGVKDEEIDGTTREVRVPLYRHCTGQIRNTLYMNKSIPGCGEDNNEWLQVYFSFINDAQPNEYKEYLLQVDNYSASSNGADIYFDDIRCYVAKPRPRVTQQKLTCGERTRVRMDLNWEQLISRLGLEELTDGTNTNNGIDFCFIDVEEYEKALKDENFAEALEAAAVEIGNVMDYNKKYGSLYYDLNYEENAGYTPYDISKDGNGDYGSLAYKNEKNESNKYFFYRATAGENDAPYANGERLLSVDFYANMSLAREYMILIRERNSTSGEAGDFSTFGNPKDPCAITANFQVQGQNLIKMNGEIVKPGETNDYCTGQIFDFSVDMQYLVDGKYVSYTTDDIHFDWFFGTEEEFNGTDEDTNTDEESLRDALYALRKTISDVEATSVWDETEKKWKLQQSADKTVLDTKYVTIIEKYLNEKPADDRLQAKLVLRSKTLEIRILEHGLDLVVAPIDTRDKSSTGADITLCFEPMYLHLTAANKAPQVQPGFEYMQYERDIYNPAMRIGLQQIKDSKSKGIEVNLRNANFAFDTEEYKGNAPTHIGLLYDDEDNSTHQEGDNYIYLTASNDPMLEGILHPTDGTEFDRSGYIIGTVEELKATPYSNSSGSLPDNKMKIKFKYGESMVIGEDSGQKFEPREGYEYTFTILIEEHTDNHRNPKGACRGTLNLTMKVVPEYLVWQGTSNTQNWNNDALWKRATVNQLKKSSSDEYKDYNDAEIENYPGYVPMLFSKVIMPEGNKVELYEAGFTGSSDFYKNMKWETELPEYMESPSTSSTWNDGGHPIQYDMMVYTDDNGEMSTKPYRVNLCEQIHFEPNAEMLHAELLTYEKAWVDYKLESNQWHTLASPLQDVVAGDFYTDSEAGTGTNNNVAGTENQEYFTPITFEKDADTNYNNANNNSRFSPSVYQRGWKGTTNMVTVSDGTQSKNNVAVSGNWSAVYNDVYDEYKPGEGFSLKVLDIPDSQTDAIFRLPKADPSYKYYTKALDDEGNIIRGKSHRLAISDYTPTDGGSGDSESKEVFRIELTKTSNDDYYLVGNPFMANLDAKKFLTDGANSSLADMYWFNDADGVQNIVAIEDGDWITTDSETAPIIPPLHSFFVRKADNASGNVTVTFKDDMQVLGTATSDETTNTNALILMAKTADGKTSRAAIAYDAMAKATYEASEDAELFLDSNLSDVPTIYTVAGTMATSINRTSELYNIPVGIYGNSTEMVTLSFEGLNHFSSATLYDAEKKTETPLHEGTTLTVPASTSGRYFLRAGTPTANEVIETSDIQIYTLSGNRVMVTSNVPLKDIRVYTMNGAQVKHTKAGVCSFELYLADGIYLITAQNTSGETQTEKVVVQ